MTKPRYKLGDIIRDTCIGTEELVIAMCPVYTMYEYKTQNITGHSDGAFNTWMETTIDKYYEVTGNIFSGGTND